MMKNSVPKSANKKKSHGKAKSSGGKKVGYIVSIIVLIIVIYVLRHLREWGVTFLTEDFSKCLFYIEISIYASIGAQVLFLLYDNRWFKHLIQALTNIAGAVALIMIYVIFPFDFGDATWTRWIRIGILVLFGLTLIGVIVDLVKGIRYLVKDPEAV
jgi:hypothetical protein